jgi:hypothetical protein
MGWQKRDNRRYYYLAVRENGRPRNHYLGKAAPAELASAKLEQIRARRDAVRAEFRTMQEELRKLDLLIDTVDHGASGLLEATYLARGFYKTNRRWRGTRRVRELTAQTR